MEIIFLAGAVFFICIAHIIRVIRWELFIEIYERPQRKTLILSLYSGYLFNYIIPYKLGDLCRAWLAGRRMKNGYSLALSTIISERYMDIISVGIIFTILWISNLGDNNLIRDTAIFYMCSALLLLGFMVLIYIFRETAKKVFQGIASIFNEKIELAFLCLAWALIWNFKDIFQRINKIKLIVTTVGMWICYLLSYYLFSALFIYLGENVLWIDVFTMLFQQSGVISSTGKIMSLFGSTQSYTYSIYTAVYMVFPLIITFIVFSRLCKKNIRDVEEERYLNLIPHLDPGERLEFLEKYFSNGNKEYVANYLKINRDISIIRDYSAGSNATTMLCMDGKNTFFRKYAFGEDGEKLYQQIQWITENEKHLKLPQILHQQKTEFYCYYDMPYYNHAVGLFEYAHSMPVEDGWNIIKLALESFEKSIYKINMRPADSNTIYRYIRLKVNKNLNIIKNSKRIRLLQQYKTIFINGIEYKNLLYCERYLKEDILYDIFKNDTYAVIHGDLTIENIICTRGRVDEPDDFYIIDPNTGNIHNSPNLDYGKLLQSIHGGYEFLMSAKEVSVTNNRINFLSTKSLVYIELHKLLKEYMRENFSYERIRSIYFHEIIHWLRLMPYKIQKDSKRALLFYAGMIIVMNDVIKMYGDERGGE